MFSHWRMLAEVVTEGQTTVQIIVMHGVLPTKVWQHGCTGLIFSYLNQVLWPIIIRRWQGHNRWRSCVVLHIHGYASPTSWQKWNQYMYFIASGKWYPSKAVIVSWINAFSLDVHGVEYITQAFVSDQEKTALASEQVSHCHALHVQWPHKTDPLDLMIIPKT